MSKEERRCICLDKHAHFHRDWRQRRSLVFQVAGSILFALVILASITVPRSEGRRMNATEVRWLIFGGVGSITFMFLLLLQLDSAPVALNYAAGMLLCTTLLVPHYDLTTVQFFSYWLPASAAYVIWSLYSNCFPFVLHPGRPSLTLQRHYQQ